MRQQVKSLKRPFSKRKISIFVVFVVVGGIGVYLLTASHALSPYVTAESESGTLATGATVGSDSTASGSSFVKFKSGTTGGGNCPPYTSSSTSAGCGFPSAATTGPPSGTVFHSQSSSSCNLVITAANTVIDGLQLAGCIDVEASNVTIQNSHITSNTWWGVKFGFSNSSATGFKLLHSTVDSTPGKGPDAQGGYDYGVIQNNSGSMEVGFDNISGFKNGIDSTNTNIHDNYIHDLSYFTGAHTQDVYFWPGPSTVTHNTLINQVPLSNSTAALYIAPDSSNQHDVTVTNNWMAGGAYTFYGGDTNAKNIKVTNNVFSTEIFANGGSYGPDATSYWHANGSGNVWSGNVWGNGSKAGQTINP